MCALGHFFFRSQRHCRSAPFASPKKRTFRQSLAQRCISGGCRHTSMAILPIAKAYRRWREACEEQRRDFLFFFSAATHRLAFDAAPSGWSPRRGALTRCWPRSSFRPGVAFDA
jgi:hypothetical protein